MRSPGWGRWRYQYPCQIARTGPHQAGLAGFQISSAIITRATSRSSIVGRPSRRARYQSVHTFQSRFSLKRARSSRSQSWRALGGPSVSHSGRPARTAALTPWSIRSASAARASRTAEEMAVEEAEAEAEAAEEEA